MILTIEQRKSLENGEPVRVQDDSLDCVILRADVYERMKELLYDDGDFSPRDAYPLVDRVMAEDDASDPTLGSYQHYRRDA